MKKFILILPLFFLLTSCASYFKRKECEKTNWFDHGKKVALGGKRLDADAFYNECRKVEANIRYDEVDLGFKSGMKDYCKPTTVYSIGTKGIFFNEEFCEPHLIKKLKVQHKRGVTQFCQPKNAFKFGANGGVYNSICPKKFEKAFLVKYSQGRKRYLSGQIQDKSEQIMQNSGRINNIVSRKNSLLYQLGTLPRDKVYVQERVYNSISKKYTTKSILKEDPIISRQRRSINDQIYTLDRQVKKIEKEQAKLRAEVREHKKELRSIE